MLPIPQEHKDDCKNVSDDQVNHIRLFALNSLRAMALCETMASRKRFEAEWYAHFQQFEALRINLLTGANGGGKSTIVDMLSSLSDPTKLCGLQRENTTDDALSGYTIETTKGHRFCVAFRQYVAESSMDRQEAFIRLTNNPYFNIDSSAVIPKFSATVSDVIPLEPVYKAFACRVENFDGRNPPEVAGQALAEELCRIRRHLFGTNGIAESALVNYDDDFAPPGADSLQREIPIDFDGDYFQIWLHDDLSQTSRVTLNQLPSGWRAFGRLTAWLDTRPCGSICTIEEPESHLHPTFQRLLAMRIGEIAQARGLQLFIATHSPTFLNTQSWAGLTPKVFALSNGRLTDRPNIAGLLRALGMRQSDFLQANGVVWVEGPSDAIYVRYWIDLVCETHNIQSPLEDAEYSYAYYGGAVLPHYSVGRQDGLINLLRLNTNFIAIMDRDMDFEDSGSGQLVPLNPDHFKAKLMKAIEELRNHDCWAWVTDSYTIESYLPDGFRNKYFRYTVDGRLEKTSTLSKVAIAQKFVAAKYDYTDCFESAPELSSCMLRLVRTIANWNSI